MKYIKNIIISGIILLVSAVFVAYLLNENSYDTNKEDEIITASKGITTSFYKTEKPTSTSKKTMPASTSNSITTTKKLSTTQTIKFPIDVNLITVEQLMEIDGIGEVLADRIIKYRQSNGYIYDLSELKNISGIGIKTYQLLKTKLFVDKIIINKNTKTIATTTTTNSIKTTTKSLTMLIERQHVNINTATKEELINKLLIKNETAEKIVELKSKIGGKYYSIMELLLILTVKEYNIIKDFVFI